MTGQPTYRWSRRGRKGRFRRLVNSTGGQQKSSSPICQLLRKLFGIEIGPGDRLQAESWIF